MSGEQTVPLEEILYAAKVNSQHLTAEAPSKNGSRFLYLAAGTASLISFSAGVSFGWPSPVLPKLSRFNDTDNPLDHAATVSEQSWIAALLTLGAIFGPLAAGPTASKIGRKKTLLLVALPMTLSMLITAFARSVAWFYVGRILAGLGTGCVFTVLPMYLGEISEAHNRGTLGSFLAVFASFGILFSYAVGPFITIRNFCLACLVPLLVFLPVFSIWMPETPPFLAATRNHKALERSLFKLRNKPREEAQQELLNLTKSVQDDGRNAGFRYLFKTKALRKGVCLTLGIISLQQFAGINAVLAYMQAIFDSAGSGWSPEICSIVIGVVQAAGTTLASSLVDRVGRRLLLLTSAVGSGLSLVALGTYFYLISNHQVVLAWLPTTSLVLYFVAFTAGLGPLPFLVMAELVPTNVISASATLAGVTCFLAGFIVTLSFPSMISVLGIAQSYWCFAGVCLAGAVFIYSALPETKGKSLREIQRLLEGTSK